MTKKEHISRVAHFLKIGGKINRLESVEPKYNSHTLNGLYLDCYNITEDGEFIDMIPCGKCPFNPDDPGGKCASARNKSFKIFAESDLNILYSI